MRVVIIGNSAAAVGAIESLRQYDQRAEVLVISEEPHLIYSRPLLSHYLGGEIDRSRLAFRPSNFYTRHNVQPILHTRVVAINTAERSVEVAPGDQPTPASTQCYHYDKLLISTGGLPIVPPMPGLDAQGVYTFTRLDDAQALVEEIKARDPKHAVVVGGGMIGIKAVEGLTQRHIPVTVVELAPRILTAALDQTACDLLTRVLNEHGVSVLTESTVTEIVTEEPEGAAMGSEPAAGAAKKRITAVTLKDGRRLPCDLLIFGIGVRPNATLAAEAGIKVNRGVVVDEFMGTSAPDVYAAGDVAEAYDLVVDMNRVVAIWPNAYRQGAIAGAHMAGISRPDRGGVAMNTVDVCGIPAMSIGNANVDPNASHNGGPPYEVMSQLDEKNVRYKRLVLQGDYLVGAILVGNVNRAGVYTGLIRNKINIANCRKSLMSDNLSLLSLPDQYRKHIVTGSGIEV